MKVCKVQHFHINFPISTNFENIDNNGYSYTDRHRSVQSYINEISSSEAFYRFLFFRNTYPPQTILETINTVGLPDISNFILVLILLCLYIDVT